MFLHVDGGSTFGMKIFDGTGTADSDILVELGEGGNTIAGQVITPVGMTAGDAFQVTGSTGQMTASLAYIGNATNFFQVKSGGVAINTSNCDLTTATVTMSSAVSGKIAMGSTPPTASGGNGILLSGSGDFSFQSANNAGV